MKLTSARLEDFIGGQADNAMTLPITVQDVTITEDPPPQVLANLEKLKRLGILNGDALLSLVGQAPIDPINLAGTLMRLLPEGWAFSSVDFSMVRILARVPNDTKEVSAALRVDLMGDSIQFLARNRAGHLTLYKTYEVKPSEKTWDEVQLFIKETIAAAHRETRP